MLERAASGQSGEPSRPGMLEIEGKTDEDPAQVRDMPASREEAT